MRRTTALSFIFGFLLLGLVLGRLGWQMPVWLLAGPAAIAVLAWKKPIFPVVIIVLALTLGVWRGHTNVQQQSQLMSLIGQKLTVTGVVANDPATDPRGFTTFALENLTINGHAWPGSLSVFRQTTRYLERGYKVTAVGKLKPGFANVPVELSYPTLQVLSRHQSPLERFRQGFFLGIHTALPDPMASFALGLLVGIRALIPKPLQQQLALVGLSHLVAVSGYNLTIIVAAAERILHRFGKSVALAASLWLIGTFIVIAGAGPTIMRAALVSVLVLVASFYGRRFHPLVLTFGAAAATAFYQPSYLTDLGWLLSFAAFFGILVLAPAVSGLLGQPRSMLVKLLIETCCAQLMTVPIILHSFSQLSLVAPLSNLMVLPFVPLAMLLSFVAGLGGMLVPALAPIFGLPANWLLSSALWLVNWLAHLPGASEAASLSLGGLVAMYGCIVAITFSLTRKLRLKQPTQPDSSLV